MYTTEDLEIMHKALHTENETHAIVTGARIFPIKIAGNGCRKVDVYHYGTLMEQNPKTSSRYARRAQKGEHLSWFIPAEGDNWRLFTNEGEEKN